MHSSLCLLSFLLTTPALGFSQPAHQNQDEGSSKTPLVSELDMLNTERAGFDLMVQNPFNWTRRSQPRGPKRTLPRSLLESRQNTGCNPSNYVLVCPPTENSPCCPPGFPVCCHDPSDACCPEGTFCQGLQTCCGIGSVGCGESCCPPPLVCGSIAGTPTCVDPSSSTVAATSTQGFSTTVRGQGGASQTNYGGSTSIYFPEPSVTSSESSSVSPTIIGAATGGGVGGLILIGLLAWFFLRKKAKKNAGVPGPEAIPTPYTNGATGEPPMAGVGGSSPAYPEGNAPLLMHKANHPWSPNSQTASPSGFPYGTPPRGASYGNSGSPPPPGSVAGIVAMSDAGSSGVVGPGGYVPPPLEDVPHGSPSYYGSGPLPIGGPSVAPPSSVYGPSHHHSISGAGTQYSNAPWASGVISPSIEQQQQHHQQQQQQQTPWTSGVSPPPHEQQQQQSQMQMQQAPPQPWLHPGLVPSPSPMSPPPPPFSPGPGMFGVPSPANETTSSSGGRQVPMTAPADRKARFTSGNPTS